MILWLSSSTTCSISHIRSFILLLVFHVSRCIAQAGSISLFLDASCSYPSTVLPTTSVELLTCVVPVGVFGVVVNEFPACPGGGSARMIMYKDALCSQSIKGGVYNKCLYNFPTFTVASLMFTCEAAPSEPRPSTTITATASRLAGVATGDPSSSKPPSTTTTAAGGSSKFVTSTSGLRTPTIPTPTPTREGGASETQGGSGSGNGSGGLSTSDKIAIGVGVGIGAPTLLVGVLALLVTLGFIKRCW